MKDDSEKKILADWNLAQELEYLPAIFTKFDELHSYLIARAKEQGSPERKLKYDQILGFTAKEKQSKDWAVRTFNLRRKYRAISSTTRNLKFLSRIKKLRKDGK